ncbi:MAG TPA: aspartate-semialdehyde dehydrogenase [Thermoplasmata archaeon]|nr:aspartate-semialdehyde dehydrogenase [Thermoplasmata archaeon]
MSDDGVPCAILGASGYIGQHFARLLADHPWFARPTLVATERSEGKTLSELWQLAEPPPAELEASRLVARTAKQLTANGIRVVFSALPSGTAAALESELVRRGVSVFSNAADHRMDPHVPLLVPEVNADHLELAGPGGPRRPILVTNPNCSTTGLVLALAPVRGLLAPRAVHVATYQSLSGAGYPGVPSLTITDNVVPFIREEEEKIRLECARILGRRRGSSIVPSPVPFLAHCVRVATREGHLEAVTVEATRRPRLDELESAWRSFDPLSALGLPTAPERPVELRHEPDRPQPLRDRWAGQPARARGMTAVVGRVRWSPPYLRFFVLSHNAVRGGAGASVLNAELAYQRGLIGPSGEATR